MFLPSMKLKSPNYYHLLGDQWGNGGRLRGAIANLTNQFANFIELEIDRQIRHVKQDYERVGSDRQSAPA